MSICINDFVFRDLTQPIYVGTRRIGKVMVGEKKVYPDVIQYRARYAQWIMFPAVISKYGDMPVDQYGAFLRINEDAVVTKCCFRLYLKGDGSLGYRKLGVQAQNVTTIKYVPFLAYKGQIIYNGEHTSGINLISLKWDLRGFYTTDKIDADLVTAEGDRLSNYSIEFDQENVKLVYSDGDFENYLST